MKIGIQRALSGGMLKPTNNTTDGVGLVGLVAKFQSFKIEKRDRKMFCKSAFLPGGYTVKIITILKYWVGQELSLA